MMRAAARRLLASTRGTTAVEFAIVGAVFISLCIGAIDVGRTLYVKNQISSLADAAMRKVMIDPSISDTTVADELRADFFAGDPSTLSVTMATESVGAMNYRVVTVDYPLTLFVPFLTSDSINLSVTRRVPTD